MPGPRGALWEFGAVGRLLRNERVTGKQIWGQKRFDRKPGTRQKVARHLPRAEWRIRERPDLRIVSDELWEAVEARRRIAAVAPRQTGSSLMRGKSAVLHSRHLFSGFMRCGICGGAISVVSGGWGSPRYGCQQHSKNGATACTNRLTIRAKIADAALLASLQAELLRPETVAYIADRLASALNAVIERRPAEREEVDRTKTTIEQKLKHLIAAVEAGAGAPTVLQAIRDRETELIALEAKRNAFEEPLEQRLAVIPSWVRAQLADAAGLLSDTPERAKAEFQRLSIKFTVSPVHEEGARPFLRAEGSGDFEHLALSQYVALTTSD